MDSIIKRNGSSRQWRNIRQTILNRDNNTCYYCGIPTATTVDHLTPLNKGGTHSIHNLVAACKKCNFSKGDRTEEEYIKSRNRKHKRQAMKKTDNNNGFFAGHRTPPTPASKTSPKEFKTPFQLPKGVSCND